jgi:hypothetical protein
MIRRSTQAAAPAPAIVTIWFDGACMRSSRVNFWIGRRHSRRCGEAKRREAVYAVAICA